MRSKASSIAVSVALLTATPALLAHHYSAAVFDLSQKVIVTGTLTSLDWRNPHIEFSVESAGDKEPGAWKIESNGPTWFRSRNIGRATFENAIGHAVTIQAVRAKDGSRWGLLQRITFADGTTLAVSDNATPTEPREGLRRRGDFFEVRLEGECVAGVTTLATPAGSCLPC